MTIASRALAALLLTLKSEWSSHFLSPQPDFVSVGSTVVLGPPGGLRGAVDAAPLADTPPTCLYFTSLCGGGEARELKAPDHATDDAISEEAQVELDHFIDSVEAHITAAMFSIIATVVSVHLIWMHLVYYSRPLLQRQIVRIILIVPVYAVCSAFSLAFEHYAVYINTVRDIYEAYCIHCFLVLMLDFPGGEPAVVEGIKDKGLMAHPKPCCCWPKMRLGVDFIVAMKRTTLQFVILKPLMAMLALILMATDTFHLAAAQWFLLVVYNLSYTTALYGLLLFYFATKTLLKGFSPVGKFSSVKVIVFATYYQSLIVVAIPGMDELGSSERWNDFIICFEMALFAVMFNRQFHYSEFMPGGVGVKDLSAQGYEEPVNLRHDTSWQAALGRLGDVFDFKDTWADLKRNFSSDAGNHIMLGVEGGIHNEGTAQRLDDDDGESDVARAARLQALGLGGAFAERQVKETPVVELEKKKKGAPPVGVAGFMARAWGGGAGLADRPEGEGAGCDEGAVEAVIDDSFGDMPFSFDAQAGDAGEDAAAAAYAAVLAAGTAKAAETSKEQQRAAEAKAADHRAASDKAAEAAVKDVEVAATPPSAPEVAISTSKAAAALLEASTAAAAEMLRKLKEAKAAAPVKAAPAAVVHVEAAAGEHPPVEAGEAGPLSPVAAASKSQELSSRQRAALSRAPATLKLDASKVHANPVKAAVAAEASAWNASDVSFGGSEAADGGEEQPAGQAWGDAAFGEEPAAAAPVAADTSAGGWVDAAFGAEGEPAAAADSSWDDAVFGAGGVAAEGEPAAAEEPQSRARAPSAEEGGSFDFR